MESAIPLMDKSIVSISGCGTFEMISLGKITEHSPVHAHDCLQVVFSLSTPITVEVAGRSCLIPVSTALLIPAHAPHRLLQGGAECVVLFHFKATDPLLDQTRCRLLMMSCLLRELVFHLQSSRTRDARGEASFQRYAHIFLEELQCCEEIRLPLPMPNDRRLQRLINAYVAQPTRRRSLEDWGNYIGMSSRSLARLFRCETGLSFGEWTRRFQVTLALQQLTSGLEVGLVAESLGFSHPSAFIAMFKKVLGESPLRFVQQQTTRQA